MFGREVVSVISCRHDVLAVFCLCFMHKITPWLLFSQDNSDTQYRSFRNNILSLSFLVLIFITLKYIYTRSALRSALSIPSDKLYLIPFFLVFSVLYLTGLHGTSIFKIVIILTANYWIAKTSKGSRMGPLLTWVFNVSILFANETHGGYRYASFHPSLEVLVRYSRRLSSTGSDFSPRTHSKAFIRVGT